MGRSVIVLVGLVVLVGLGSPGGTCSSNTEPDVEPW